MRVTIPELSLVLLIGPAGSGKSTFAARHFRHSEVLSLDAVRTMIADEDTDEGALEAAWGALVELAARRMEWGRLTVIDANLVAAARRQALLQLAAEHHYIASAFVFATPEPTCQIWNGQRPDCSVSPLQVSRQHEQLRASEGALAGEGFRHLFRFASAEELNAVEVNRLPLWSSRREEVGPFDIVGSVHGRYDELAELLRRLGYRLTPVLGHPRGRKLVFLGDLVDHGPRNADVLRLVMSAVDAGVAFSVPGNHDARLVRWLRGEMVDQDGGMAATVAEFAAAPVEFRQAVESFLYSSVSHYVFDTGNLVVAHAGMKESLQGRGSAGVRAFALYGEFQGEREAEAEGTVPGWVLEYQGAARVVYSHPLVSEPLWLNQTVNLDTGAASPGGKVSALRYPEMQLISVPVAMPAEAAATSPAEAIRSIR